MTKCEFSVFYCIWKYWWRLLRVDIMYRMNTEAFKRWTRHRWYPLSCLKHDWAPFELVLILLWAFAPKSCRFVDLNKIDKLTCSSKTPYFFTKSAVSAASARASALMAVNGKSVCCFLNAESSLFDSRWTRKTSSRTERTGSSSKIPRRAMKERSLEEDRWRV